MQISAEQAVLSYADAYHKLYKRMPKDLHALDTEWIVINGARLQACELQLVTMRLQQEYARAQEQKRTLVNRMIHWLKQ